MASASVCVQPATVVENGDHVAGLTKVDLPFALTWGAMAQPALMLGCDGTAGAHIGGQWHSRRSHRGATAQSTLSHVSPGTRAARPRRGGGAASPEPGGRIQEPCGETRGREGFRASLAISRYGKGQLTLLLAGVSPRLMKETSDFYKRAFQAFGSAQQIHPLQTLLAQG